MAEPNTANTEQILTLLALSREQDTKSSSGSVDHKGVIKDSERDSSSLTPNEETRIKKISAILAGAIGDELLKNGSLNTSKQPPEKNLSKFEDTKIGGAINNQISINSIKKYIDAKENSEKKKDAPAFKQPILGPLTPREVERYTQIATIFGKVLRIGAFKTGPEAGRLTAPEAQKVAPTAVRDKIKPAQMNGSDLAKLLAGLLGLSLFDGFGDAIKRWLATKLTQLIVHPFKRLISWAGKKLWGAVKWLTGKLWSGVKWLSGKIWGGVKWLSGKIWSGAKWVGKKTWGIVWGAVKWLSGKLWDGIKWLGKKIYNWSVKLVDKIKNSKFYTGFMDKVKAAKDGLKSTWDDAINAVKGYIDDIAKYIINFKDAALNALKRIPGYNLVKKGVEKTTELAVKGATATKDLAVRGAAATKDLAVKGATATKDLAVKGATATKNLAVKGATAAKGMADDAVSSAVSYGKKKLTGWLGNALKGGTKLVGKFFQKLPIIGPIVEGAFAAYDIKSLKEQQEKGEISLDDLHYQAGRRVVTGITGLIGASLGAIAGSALFPPVGTILGSIGGDILARWLGGLLVDKVMSPDITKKLGAFVAGGSASGEMQDFIIRGNNVYKFSSKDEVLGMKTGGAIESALASLKQDTRTAASVSENENPVLLREAQALGWKTVDEYIKSGKKQNPTVLKGLSESQSPALLRDAQALGWKTVEEYNRNNKTQNTAVLKGLTEAESPALLRDAQAMGWKTVKEYVSSGFKQNPAVLTGYQAMTAVPGSATTAASFADTAAASAASGTGLPTPGMGVAPSQVSAGLQTAYNTPATPAASAPLNQDIKANIAAVMEAVKAKGFTNEKYLAAVYGNVMKETGGKIMAENMNYSTTSNARIRSIFGSRVAGMSDAQINQIKSTPESFGNAMYGGHTRIGKNLGNVEPGDGFKFRGRGFVQLTGRAAYAKASKAIFGDDRLVQNPDLVLDRQVGALVTAWELEDRKSWAGKYGIDYNNMTQEQANMLVTSKIAGTRVTRGRGYLGSLLTKVDTYASQYNPANFAGASGSSAVAAAPAASGPPYTEQSVMPASAQSSSSQFQPQQIAMPAASGAAAPTTTWTGGESNFNINGANMGGLNSEFRRRLESMAAEYRQKTGKKINVSGPRSAYRTYEQQVSIHRSTRPGYAATPGTSNHGFGFALDINTVDANKAESLGLLSKYGLHRPMMSKRLYEPWHLEPVGLNKGALAQYRAKRESGKFTGDQLAFALGGSGSSGPPYTEQSVMPVPGAIAATPNVGSGLPTIGTSGIGESGGVGMNNASSAPAVGSSASGSFGLGGLFSGIANIFSGGPTAQSAGGGIANLSTSSVPAPMAAAGAESSITSKMDDIASKQNSKAEEEIGVLKGIDSSIKELTKQISALSRVTINNVSGEGSKTSIASANIPDTDTRLRPQTSSGFLGGKMFGFG